MASFSSRVGASWVPEGQAIPISRAAIAGRKLAPQKVAGIFVMTNESLQAYGETVEAALQEDLERSVANLIDLAFADPFNAGIADERPAGIAYGATTISTTGSLKADIEAAFDAYDGSVSDAVFLVNPRVAVRIATQAAQLGDSKVGANGGVLVGVPVYTSEHVPYDSDGAVLILLDASAVRYAYRGVSFYRTKEASVEMDDAPTNDSVIPAAATQVSMWQTNCSAFKAEAEAAWTLESAGRAVVVTGADYSEGS